MFTTPKVLSVDCREMDPPAFFSSSASPVVPVVKIRGWQLDEGIYTPENPAAPFDCDPEVTRIDLVPYGTTCLRLTVFPVAI